MMHHYGVAVFMFVMVALCGLFPCCDDPKNRSGTEFYQQSNESVTNIAKKPTKDNNLTHVMITFGILAVVYVVEYTCYKCCCQKLLKDSPTLNLIVIILLIVVPVVFLTAAHFETRATSVLLMPPILSVIIGIGLDQLIVSRYKKKLSKDFGVGSLPFIIEKEYIENNNRVVVEALAFNYQGDELTLEEAFTFKAPFFITDYWHMLFYRMPKQFLTKFDGLRKSSMQAVSITEEQFTFYQDIRCLSQFLRGNSVTIKITHKDIGTGDVDLDIQTVSQKNSTAVDNSCSLFLDSLKKLVNFIKALLSFDSSESSSTPKFFIQDATVHFDGARCERLILSEADFKLKFTGKRVAQVYSEAEIEEFKHVEKNKTVDNLGNVPPVWRPTRTKRKKDFKKEKELALVTMRNYANFIAQFTPRPGAISVAQDKNGNTMFALSVRKDRRGEFDRIMTRKQWGVLEAIPTEKRGDGHKYCSEQVITHNILAFQDLQFKAIKMPEIFGIDQKIEISAFGAVRNVEYNESTDMEMGVTAFGHKFKYTKPIPACSTCEITNRSFGFTDKHAHVDDERKRNEIKVKNSNEPAEKVF